MTEKNILVYLANLHANYSNGEYYKQEDIEVFLTKLLAIDGIADFVTICRCHNKQNYKTNSNNIDRIVSEVFT